MNNTTHNISKQSIAIFNKAIDNLNKKQHPNIVDIVNKAYNESLLQKIPERPVKPKKEYVIEPDIEPVNLCISCKVDMGYNNK